MVASSARTQELEDQVATQERAVAELTGKLEETVKALEDTKATAAATATEAAAAHEAAAEQLKKSHAAEIEEMVNKALDIEVLLLSFFEVGCSSVPKFYAVCSVLLSTFEPST